MNKVKGEKLNIKFNLSLWSAVREIHFDLTLILDIKFK